MSAAQTVLRMAMAMLAADPRAAITPTQRQWLLDQLQGEHTITDAATRAITPHLLAWADGRSTRLGATLRETLGLTPRAADPQASGLALLAKYPGLEAQEQAAALAERVSQDVKVS